ncbi:MAG: DUF6460 domain-containing protein [Cohaesibacter sp.]|jgi:hypothetical protein|nr:DUF6460 domain-containing protein [Cohaesibacter sp.]
MSRSNLTRFFGGSPGPVLVRLAVLSLVVGIVLSALNLHPMQLIHQFGAMIERIYYMGFEAIGWAVEYFLLGALVVLPVWLVMRLMKYSRNEPD